MARRTIRWLILSGECMRALRGSTPTRNRQPPEFYVGMLNIFLGAIWRSGIAPTSIAAREAGTSANEAGWVRVWLMIGSWSIYAPWPQSLAEPGNNGIVFYTKLQLHKNPRTRFWRGIRSNSSPNIPEVVRNWFQIILENSLIIINGLYQFPFLFSLDA